MIGLLARAVESRFLSAFMKYGLMLQSILLFTMKIKLRLGRKV